MPSADSPSAAPLGARTYIAVAVATVLLNLPLLANPGFFSHDEWQFHDIVTLSGLLKFIDGFGRLSSGSSFGVPVRPLGFVQLGLTTFGMDSFPLAPHAFNVLLHAVVVLVFARVLNLAGFHRLTATLAALLFATSPLAAFATGWTAASFDQWYTLFVLLALLCALTIRGQGYSAIRIALLFLVSAAALLSKETGIIAPVAVAGGSLALDLLRGTSIRWKTAAALGAVSAAPFLFYVPIRAQAIVASLHQTGGAYTPSIRNVPYNALTYFAFPFLPNVGELVTGMPIAMLDWVAALAIHGAIVACLAWRYGWRGGLAYFFFYYVFLLPVLTIQSVGSHYLYASGLALAAGLACLIADASAPRMIAPAALLGIPAAGVLVWHFAMLQDKLYGDGVCQRAFLTSLDTQIESNGDTAVVIHPAQDAKWWVGARAVFERPRYPNVRFVMDDPKTTANYTMNADCHVVAMHARH